MYFESIYREKKSLHCSSSLPITHPAQNRSMLLTLIVQKCLQTPGFYSECMHGLNNSVPLFWTNKKIWRTANTEGGHTIAFLTTTTLSRTKRYVVPQVLYGMVIEHQDTVSYVCKFNVTFCNCHFKTGKNFICQIQA